MPDHRRDPLPVECPEQAEHVEEQVVHAEGREVGLVGDRPRGGTPVATLIWGDDVVPGLREGGHHLSPGIGQLGKPCSSRRQGRPGPRVRPPAHACAGRSHPRRSARGCPREERRVQRRQVRCIHVQAHCCPPSAPNAVWRQPSRGTCHVVRQHRKRAGTRYFKTWITAWGGDCCRDALSVQSIGLWNPTGGEGGFEPPMPLQACRISSAVHSTALPPLREVPR